MLDLAPDLALGRGGFRDALRGQSRMALREQHEACGAPRAIRPFGTFAALEGFMSPLLRPRRRISPAAASPASPAIAFFMSG
jgi:hypothetical protein